MKKRIITGILLFIFVAPFVIFGSYPFAIFTLLLMVLGIYEFLDIKRKANMDKIPLYIFILAMVLSYLLIFGIPTIDTYCFNYKEGYLPSYGLSPLWLILSCIVLFTSSIFDKKYSIMDAFYTLATMVFLSLGLKGLLFIRSYDAININSGTLLVCYLLIVTCATDIFAYFGGITCKKILGEEKTHKLNERISPKKTVEGTIIGTLLGVGLGFIFAYFALDNILAYPWYDYLILSLALSIAGQIGDLILSANKRYFAIKDYSNLLPGHGGVLDRIDSLLVNSMVAAIIITLIEML